MKNLHKVTFILLIIGGLNWLLIGLFGWGIGMLFGGQMALVSRLIWIIVGLATINEIVIHKSICKMCDGK